MSYYYAKTIETDFAAAIERVTAELKKEGFGVISEIDMKSKLSEKLGVEFRNYKILGACNPPYAYKALQAEDKIGTMLPCNVIVQEIGENRVEVAAINPLESMQAVKNESLAGLAQEVAAKLRKAIDNL